eukprot:GEZU01029159.1.p3 GENE.GEZU01029159.1~~GEZU01029159.1.p3  ORF type:complete len:145 (-),score=36.32 GEZU01029159.1:1014-1448(-)
MLSQRTEPFYYEERHFNLKPKVDKPDDYETVVIDVKKLDESWRNTDPDSYINSRDTETYSKYTKFRKFLEGSIGHEEEKIDLPLMKFDKSATSSDIDLAPKFIDGRHRFAVLRDEGLEWLPVAVPKQQADDVRRVFGHARSETH